MCSSAHFAVFGTLVLIFVEKLYFYLVYSVLSGLFPGQLHITL